jgi:NAD(P)-dependent dehydrogenase (short-subunit alcohol dehydrogenase family)
MTENTETKILLVTGGSRGLGRETALDSARAGLDVVLTYRSGKDEAERVVAEIADLGRRAVALPLDTSEHDSFDAFAEALRSALTDTWGRDRFDALVNNAGFAVSTPLGDTTADQLDALFAVHVKGVFLLTQALTPLMNDGGRILNISTGLARFVNPGDFSAYAAMKAGVEVLTRYWAMELGSRGITVNAVAPGPVATDFGGGAVRDVPQVAEAVAQQVALGRAGEADEIGSAVAAILSDDFRWVDGARIEVSGGQNL